MARIMGIDYGTKRVGLSVTDPLKIIVNPLDTVPEKELLGFLESYFQQEEVECVVVGEPFHMDGTPSQITPQIEKFIADFKNKFPKIAVERQDERFTSEEAKRIIRQSGARKKQRRDKSLVDKISAVLILQDFLHHR